MDKEKLTDFLFKARTKTYAGAGGKVEAALKDSYQLEFTEGDFLYRDVYYNGKNSFMGLEGIYYKDKLVWGMSYYGGYKGITEEEIDNILREALIDNPRTRAFEKIGAEFGEYQYENTPDLDEGIDEIGGTERVTKNGKEIYIFYYAGSLLE